ncbi:MAG: hypothetical protein JXR65_05375 [Bacteroidales bacterium]|nr:hypothetical protein [Bacteroidales bacterium]
MKKTYSILAFIVILLQIPTQGKSQDRSLSKDLYGLNPLLYNGEYYTYSPPANTKGNQFLKNNHFFLGSVEIKGTVYDSLKLNYDVFNQKLIMEFHTVQNNRLLISLSSAWLDSFTINNMHFRSLKVDGHQKEFFQAFGDGYFKILYFWHKNMNFVSSTGSSYYVFSRLYKTSMLLEGNNTRIFKSNTQFIRLFSKNKRQLIGKFIRQHKINLRKASDNQVQELINYCNTLPR